MKISIIVPVYNCENYMRKCFDSLVNQTIDDYEIIAINDGSKDSSQKIIEEYAFKYPFIRYREIDNGGQGRARNIGIEMSHGDYIGFADADDYVGENMFEKLYNLATADDADIAVCDFYRFSENTKTYEKAALQQHPLSAAGAVWNKLFKKEIINDVRFPSGLWYEDLEFSAKAMLRANKISYLSEALYYYRSDNVSTMRNNNSKKNLDMLKVFDNIKLSLDESSRNNYEFLVINHILLESIKRVSAIGDREIVKQLREYVRKAIPDLRSCESFKNETKNRQIIMYLNYLGFDRLSLKILELKK